MLYVGNAAEDEYYSKLGFQGIGFLRVNENKKELYQYLAESCIQGTYVEMLIVSTYGASTLQSLDTFDNSNLSLCNHEEADSRIIVHVFDVVKKGFKLVIIFTSDTDVVVICIGKFEQLLQLWNYRFYLALVKHSDICLPSNI